MSDVLDAMNRRNAARRAYDKSEGGKREAAELDAAEADVRRVDEAYADLMGVARRVAAHFEYTDAPLGKAAREAIAKAERRGS